MLSPSPLIITLVGDHNPDILAYQAIPLALDDGAAVLDIPIDYRWLATDAVTTDALEQSDGIWLVPGSPYHSEAGAIQAVRYARENGVPFLGTCGGFQHAVLEYARNVLGWQDANHGETHQDGRLVVTPLACSLVEVQAQVELRPHTLVAKAWGQSEIDVGYHCNYGVAPAFISAIADQALKVTGWDEEGEVRALELTSHPFFVVTLFQHERAALMGKPAPLVQAFIRALAD